VAPRFEPGSGWLEADAVGLSAPRWRDALLAQPPIFARNPTLGSAVELPLAAPGRRVDRAGPLLAAIDRLAEARDHAPPWRTVWLEHPDSNDGRELSPLARALATRIEPILAQAHRLDARATLRLHVTLAGGTRGFVGTSLATSTRWPLGIPRLARAGPAPSRSAQKLAEAFLVFLGEDAPRLLRPGMRAVDLGAAPGGWTWQLAARGLKVTAVDNATLKGAVADDPLVRHLRADGLHWRPPRPVDWLTCDIVHAPLRIAELVGDWIGTATARRAIFNLKLPMKRRFETVDACAGRFHARVSAHGRRAELLLRQLYHDREEVTGYAALAD
jgi:23S rRNA (cytidine2498-2'-O)-methyltransferase